MREHLHAACLAILSIWSPVVYGDHMFQWNFGANFVQQEFTECQKVPVTVKPLFSNTTNAGVPPYYLFAFEAGGIPTTTLIGNDPTNLTWQVTHRRSASLMLSILDSNGSTGGVAPSIYNVTAGSDTSCIPPTSATSSVAKITPNVTTTLTTCEPWGLTVTGGKKPYTIVLSALNSPVITNATMGADDDVFTFIDRADPNELLMASVVDANGQWGVSSGTVLPTGSTDVDCIGLVSTSKTSAEITQEAADRAKAEKQEKARRRNLIVGLCVGLGAAALIALGLAFWWWRKRRNDINRGTWDHQDVVARAYDVPYADNTMEMQEPGSAALLMSDSKVSGVSTYTPFGTPSIEVTPIPPVYFDHEIRNAQVRAASGPGSGSTSDMASPTSSRATASSPRHRKTLEAHRQTSLGPSSPSISAYTSTSNLPSSPNSIHVDTTRSSFINAGLDPDVQPDIIIQHRDGGAGGVVHELPPPYVDRTLLKPTSPTSPSIPEAGSVAGPSSSSSAS